ncbi:enoyl-CoA hydratase [Egibacter rhizosphaerae]|uniref:Enoyl-CoA hydratase n=1 Tax=Egibacter rhizosphaerae TaxID=1670831 RepID=A0A411YL89_9ACTN|nr:enoyl-CoA hydratase [Egibacter rhizosphaerae]
MEHGDGVRELVLSAPERRNAMNLEMSTELRAAAAACREAGDRVVVVSGEGKAFCAGADLPELFGHPDRPVAQTHELLQDYYRAFLDLRDLPVPVIAAVQGAAVGAGLNLALSCDIRIAGHDATFGATFARIGLHPGGGCTLFLVRRLGASRALRTLLLGESLDAARAVEWGLADGPYEEPRDAALELAARCAQVPDDLRGHIVATTRLAEDTDDLDAVLAQETWAQAVSASSPQVQEWVDRFR